MNNSTTFDSDHDRWQAVIHRQPAADGAFVYSVKTTGVYCRPSCPARRAKRKNVRFHPTPQDAQRSGFRACKRCLPDQAHSNQHNESAVARACRLIEAAAEPLDLVTLAQSVGLSPSHLHRTFKSLTGLTPKAYAIALRTRRVRRNLASDKSVTTAVYSAGFQSNSRFYATSKKLLGMRPKTYRAGGPGEKIRFAIGQCSLGAILVAATDKGLCAVALGDAPGALVNNLQDRFPHSELIGADAKFEKLVAQVIGFVERPSAGCNLPLDIQGTIFQQRVWQLLCKIPYGKTATYAQIARRLGRPSAVRAVASAIAANQIAVAIPCHRVIRTGGALAGYRWGIDRKAALLKLESQTTTEE
jgi:AraC family transcriptional regulator, regulatory protein of adaptative response / methylated-DNA-[protein]-cysteine methyltransferase